MKKAAEINKEAFPYFRKGKWEIPQPVLL